MRNKVNPKTTVYLVHKDNGILVHRSATCFDQTWSSSGWPQEKTYIFAVVFGVGSLCFTSDII